ncbi:cerebellar degeneration-related protein 2-like isoform X2 [Thalassophryne amazonica]|uniref:cerebellar degeneration-related protein 2-like isoform X2 n=1 Tax=Thalassophryne amazonica TaxID=390379 RepID=UPI0014720DBB|nr:cerebellar degeneration-related protein 2-like isoform X2 [Thalassophryne amazonica]
MLTDMIVEEEFEIKEEEPWYDKQDLERDLQLAAELGKSLLERNRELEQGLQQVCSTNQEQLQEIEYLTKQVDLLRQVNDQHAKVYEQLDQSARELEQKNHKLSQDNRAAQQKTQGLMETVELLQTQVEELQHQVEDLKMNPPSLQQPLQEEKRPPPRSTRSVSCLKELQNTLRYPETPSDKPESYSMAWCVEEQASLQQSLWTLQTQFASERACREEAEREAELLAGENAALEQQLAGMEACQVRLCELEREAEELRQLWKAKASIRSLTRSVAHILLPDSVFFNPEEENEGDATVAKSARFLKRCCSEKLMQTPDPPAPDANYTHGCSCVRRADAIKYRGISLLNEVDAQYSALQVKYNELLQRCHLGSQEEQSHKAIQTAVTTSLTATGTDEDDFDQPEYKALFREIFSCIRKTKEDLIKNRGTSS